MRLFNKVAVIGTGLIGGSLGMFIKQNRLAGEVVGVSRRKKSLKAAVKNKAIDRGSLSLEIIKGADFIILAAPVNTIISLRNRILELAGKDCLVTDTGSTKVKIASALGKVFSNFVGSHPLAGSEKHGVIHARKDLFLGSLCLLTPTAKTPKKALNKIKALWKKAGAKVTCLTPEGHDKILSFTSHLPHAVAFSLINSIPGGYFGLASGGLKDTTRIAGSSPELWRDIFLTNRSNTLRAINSFEKNLSELKRAIRDSSGSSLDKILKQARRKRLSLI